MYLGQSLEEFWPHIARMNVHCYMANASEVCAHNRIIAFSLGDRLELICPLISILSNALSIFVTRVYRVEKHNGELPSGSSICGS